MNIKRIVLIIILLLLTSVGCEKKVEDTLVWEMVFSIGDEKDVSEVSDALEVSLNEYLKEHDIKVSISGVSLEAKNMSFEEYLEETNFSGIDLLSIPSQGIYFREGVSYFHPYSAVAEKNILLDLWSFIESPEGEKIRSSIGETSILASDIDGRLFGISAFPVSYHAYTYNIKDLEDLGYMPEDINSTIYDNDELLEKYSKNGDIPISMVNNDLRNVLELYKLPISNLIVFKDGEFQSILDLDEYREELSKRVEYKKRGLIDTEFNPDKKHLVSGFRELYYIDESSVVDGKLIVPYAANIDFYYGDAKTGIINKGNINPKVYELLTHIFTDDECARIITENTKDPENFNMLDFIRSEMLPKWTNMLISSGSGLELLNVKEALLSDYRDIIGFRFDPKDVISEIASTNEIYNVDGAVWDANLEFDRSIAERILNYTSEDLESDLEDLKLQLDNEGLQVIIDEANKQYTQWKESTNEN